MGETEHGEGKSIGFEIGFDNSPEKPTVGIFAATDILSYSQMLIGKCSFAGSMVTDPITSSRTPPLAPTWSLGDGMFKKIAECIQMSSVPRWPVGGDLVRLLWIYACLGNGYTDRLILGATSYLHTKASRRSRGRRSCFCLVEHESALGKMKASVAADQTDNQASPSSCCS